jgi:putative sterol carrier protein
MDAKKFFSEEIPNRANQPGAQDRLKGMNATYKFQIDGAGTWIVTIKDGALTVTEGDGQAQCTVIMKADDFNQLTDGKLNPQMAFMSGKLKIQGDMGLAMKLGQLLR